MVNEDAVEHKFTEKTNDRVGESKCGHTEGHGGRDHHVADEKTKTSGKKEQL